MGGNAFTEKTHGFTTSRITQTQFDSLSSFLLPLLRLYFRTVSIPPEVPGKSSYGDIDIMVTQPLDLHPHDAILQICTRVLGHRCKAFIYSVPTTNIAVSLDSVMVQVDVHVVAPPELWDVDFWMHSWGDMGMIVSSTIKTFGLRLSASRGLWINVPGHGPLVLSLNIQDIVHFLGLDWQRYSRGFTSMEEIFEWVREIMIDGRKIGVKSKGKLERREHADRPMWVAYWKFGEDVRYAPSEEEKGRGFQQALLYFGKDLEYRDTIGKLARTRIAREKLNGTRVMAWTGTSGRVLGELMKLLRRHEKMQVDNLVDMEDSEVQRVVLDVWERMARV